jgi:hypothetical protein
VVKVNGYVLNRTRWDLRGKLIMSVVKMSIKSYVKVSGRRALNYTFANDSPLGVFLIG